MICSSLVGSSSSWHGKMARGGGTLFLGEPSIDLVPDSDTGFTSVDVVSFKGGMSPEVVRGGFHPEHGLLVVRGGEDSKSMPRIDLTVGVENASGLDLVSTVHAVGEWDLSIDSLRGDAKSFGTDLIIRLESV
jgi:hypothetical protein